MIILKKIIKMYFKEEVTLNFKANKHLKESKESNLILKADFKIRSIQVKLLKERQNLNQEVKVTKMNQEVKVKKTNQKVKTEKINQKVKTEKCGIKKEIRVRKKTKIRVRKGKRKKKEIKKWRKRVRIKLEI